MIVWLALLTVGAAACSTTQAEVVPVANEAVAVEAQETPTTEAESTAPAATSSTTPPPTIQPPAEESATTTQPPATDPGTTTGTTAEASATTTQPPATDPGTTTEQPSAEEASAATTDAPAEEESEATAEEFDSVVVVGSAADAAPPTTAAATDDGESAEPVPDGFVELEIGASAGRLGGASTADDRLVLLVRCLVGQDDIYPTVVVRRQVGDPMSEWTEPASWQYRFDTSEEAVQIDDGWMTDPEVQTFTDALALTDATHLHIDTYDTNGDPELEATLGLANKHLAIEAVQSCKDT